MDSVPGSVSDSLRKHPRWRESLHVSASFTLHIKQPVAYIMPSISLFLLHLLCYVKAPKVISNIYTTVSSSS